MFAAALSQRYFIGLYDTIRANVRCRGAATRGEQEILDSGPGTSDERLHGAIAAVAHPTIEMESPGLAGDKDAVTYSLHTSFNEDSSRCGFPLNPCSPHMS